MFLGQQVKGVLQPAGDISGAGGTKAQIADSVTHWIVQCNSKLF